MEGRVEAIPDGRVAWVRRLAVTCVAMTFMLMVLGAWVKANGAGLACPDWPACYGRFIPPFPSLENGDVYHGEPVQFTQAQELYEWTHRAVVGMLVIPLLAFTIATLRKGLHPALRALPATALGLYVFQAFLGAVTVVTGNPPWATTAHLATATLFFGVQVVALMFAFLAARPVAAPSDTRPPSGGVHRETPAGTVLRSGSGVPFAVSGGRGFVWERGDPAPPPSDVEAPHAQ